MRFRFAVAAMVGALALLHVASASASSEIIPQFRGRDLDLGGLFFENVGTGSSDGGQLLLGFGSSSGITVTSWTFRLVAATTGGGGYPSFGGGYGFGGGSADAINTWTSQVFGLGG